MPRYVILRHDAPSGLHWDLMLEAAGLLRTWALASEPVADDWILARLLPGHRLHYLDYEGPISGDRGTVTRWDQGQYEPVATAGHDLAADLAGEKLRGQIMLKKDADESTWQFFFTPTGG